MSHVLVIVRHDLPDLRIDYPTRSRAYEALGVLRQTHRYPTRQGDARVIPAERVHGADTDLRIAAASVDLAKCRIESPADAPTHDGRAAGAGEVL